jgi:sugar phosphate permease
MTAPATSSPVLDHRAAGAEDEAHLRAQTGKRAAVFILTWIAYATLYFGRKGFPVVKSTLEKDHGITRDMLGWIDTGYLTAYAIGQFVNGWLGTASAPGG